RNSVVARMERSEIRGRCLMFGLFPDCASLHPGYDAVAEYVKLSNGFNKSARRANHFVFSEMACPAPFAKIFLFSPEANQFTDSCRLVPLEGRIAIVTDAGRDAVDAAASGDVRGWQGGSTRPVS